MDTTRSRAPRYRFPRDRLCCPFLAARSLMLLGLVIELYAHRSGDQRQYRVDVGLGHRSNLRRLPGFRATLHQRRNGPQCLKHAWFDHLTFDAPAEHASNPVDPCVNHLPRPAGANHVMADGLQRIWSELRHAVVSDQRALSNDRCPDLPRISVFIGSEIRRDSAATQNVRQPPFDRCNLPQHLTERVSQSVFRRVGFHFDDSAAHYLVGSHARAVIPEALRLKYDQLIWAGLLSPPIV